jgi:hypothetical protein
MGNVLNETRANHCDSSRGSGVRVDLLSLQIRSWPFSLASLPGRREEGMVWPFIHQVKVRLALFGKRSYRSGEEKAFRKVKSRQGNW